MTLKTLFRRWETTVATASARQVRSGAESGFVLIGVLFLVALIVLSLAVAAPRIADDIRRDRESEYYHRGMQYQRAIKLYVRKMGHYPTSIEQLENTNEIRFLRRRYKDPMTGKDEWRLIHLGEAKVPPMGLFGQPLTVGLPPAAVGSSIGDPSKPVSAPVDNGVGAGTGGISPVGGPGVLGASGAGPTDGTTSGSGTDTGPGSTAGGGSTGFIVGVSSNNTRESIRTYKNQTHYNQWEFVYNPQEDRGGTGIAPAPVANSGGTGDGSTIPPSGPGFNPTPQPTPPPSPTPPPGATGP